MIPNNQFRSEGAKVYRTLKFAQQACFLVLALTSVFLIFSLSMDFFSAKIQNNLLNILLANVVTIAAYFAIDGALSTFLPYVAKEALNEAWKTHSKNRRRFARILGLVCLVQLLITSTISWWSSGEIADASVVKPSNSFYTETANLQNQVHDKDRSVIELELADLKSTEGKRIKEAKKEAKRLLEEAINSKGKKMARLYHEGNGWAAKQLGKAIGQAKENGNNLIGKEQEKAPTLQSSLMTYIQQGSAGKDSVILQLGTLQLGEMQDYQKKKTCRTQTMIIVDLVAAFGAVFFTFLIALFITETETNPHANELTARHLISEVVRQKWQGLLSSLADRWDVKFTLSSPIFLPSMQETKNLQKRQRSSHPASEQDAVYGLPDQLQPTFFNQKTEQTENETGNRQATEQRIDRQNEWNLNTDRRPFQPPTANQKFDNAGKRRAPDAQDIVRFIKRFRERYRQSMLAKDESARARNKELMLQDWHFLEEMGYVIEKTDRVGKLKIFKE